MKNETKVYVGMDVHKDSVMIAVVPEGAREPTLVKRLSHDPRGIRRLLDRLAREARGSRLLRGKRGGLRAGAEDPQVAPLHPEVPRAPGPGLPGGMRTTRALVRCPTTTKTGAGSRSVLAELKAKERGYVPPSRSVMSWPIRPMLLIQPVTERSPSSVTSYHGADPDRSTSVTIITVPAGR